MEKELPPPSSELKRMIKSGASGQEVMSFINKLRFPIPVTPNNTIGFLKNAGLEITKFFLKTLHYVAPKYHDKLINKENTEENSNKLNTPDKLNIIHAYLSLKITKSYPKTHFIHKELL